MLYALKGCPLHNYTLETACSWKPAAQNVVPNIPFKSFTNANYIKRYEKKQPSNVPN